MKFDRLQASLINNADQSPSLYMALCMIESLFVDIENACGTEISRCPVGDELLPTKLIWLSRSIREIYTDNSDDLQRNRARLDSVMKKLGQTQEELEDLAEISQQLKACQAEYAALEQQLSTGKAAAREYEIISAQCGEAKQQLEILREFDPEAAVRELAAIQKDIAQLDGQNTALAAQLEAASQRRDELREDHEALKAQTRDVQQQAEDLADLLQQETDAAAQLQSRLETLHTSCDNMAALRQNLLADTSAKEAEGAALEGHITELHAQLNLTTQYCGDLKEEAEALTGQKDNLRQQVNTLEDLLRQETEACAQLQAQRQALRGDLDNAAALNKQHHGDITALETEIAALEAEIPALQSRKAELTAQLEQSAQYSSGLTREIETLKTQNANARQQVEPLTTLLQQENEVCAQLQEQLEALHTECASITALRHQLDTEAAALQSEIASLEGIRDELTLRLQEDRPQASRLQQEVEALTTEKQTLEQQIEDRASHLTQTREAVSSMQQELELRCSGLRDLEADQARLRQELEAANEEFLLLQTQVSLFREEELEPVQVKLNAIRQELAGLEQSQNELDQEYSQAKNARGQIIVDIARKKEENETLCGKLALSQENLNALTLEKKKLEDSLSKCLEALEQLQEEVKLLDAKKIPEVLHLQQQEQLRRDELQQHIDQAEAQRAAFKEDIARLEAQLPKLEEALQNDRVVYDALTANYTASSKELESLERQISELRGNNNDEKLEIYRKQLEETQRKLENIQQECGRLEQENAQRQKKLEDGQAERSRLLDLKRRHESGLEATEKQLRELAFANSEKYIREVAALEARVKLLESIRVKLGVSMSSMHRILGNAPVESSFVLEEQFLRDLRELRSHISDLQSKLTDCAKSLKLEER